jgi:hypothetical protein
MKFFNTDQLKKNLFVCGGTGTSAMLFTTGGVQTLSGTDNIQI